jgi:hypothetical protein
MLGDGSVNDSPAIVGQDDHYIEQPKRCGRHNEHIDRSNALGLIAQEAAPDRRRRPSSSHHILGDRGLAYLDAELKQFAMYPGRTPELGLALPIVAAVSGGNGVG